MWWNLGMFLIWLICIIHEKLAWAVYERSKLNHRKHRWRIQMNQCDILKWSTEMISQIYIYIYLSHITTVYYCKTRLTFHQPSIWQTPHCDTASRGGRASGRVAHKVPWTWMLRRCRRQAKSWFQRIIWRLSSLFQVEKLAQISHSTSQGRTVYFPIFLP